MESDLTKGPFAPFCEIFYHVITLPVFIPGLEGRPLIVAVVVKAA